MLINSMVVIFSKCIHISNYHCAHFKYISFICQVDIIVAQNEKKEIPHSFIYVWKQKKKSDSQKQIVARREGWGMSGKSEGKYSQLCDKFAW